MDGSTDDGASETSDPPATSGRVLSRRAVLISAGTLVLAGAAGVSAATLAPLRHRVVPSPPASLKAALDAEETLIAGIDAARTAGAPDAATRQLLAQVRADHVEHRRVHSAMIGAAIGASYAPTPSARPPGTAPDRKALRRAEQQAARDGASRAAGMRGERAARLASIAACETSHAVLLS
jgi:hypothetical protein